MFETLKDGRWFVHDSTALPRGSPWCVSPLGGTRSDAAFAAVTSGIADLQTVHVTAVADPFLLDDIASWFSSPESVACPAVESIYAAHW